jgi:hypothetical protein
MSWIVCTLFKLDKTQCLELFKNLDSLNETDYIIKNFIKRTISQ